MPNLSENEIKNLKRQGFTDDMISKMTPVDQPFVQNQQNAQAQIKNEENTAKLNEYSQNLVKALNGLVKELEKFSKDAKEDNKKDKEDKEDYLNKLKGINESLWNSLNTSITQGLDKGAESLLSSFTKGAGLWGKVIETSFNLWKSSDAYSANAKKYEFTRTGIKDLDKEFYGSSAAQLNTDIKTILGEVGFAKDSDKFRDLYRQIVNPLNSSPNEERNFIKLLGSQERLFMDRGARSGLASEIAGTMKSLGFEDEQINTSLTNVLNKVNNFSQPIEKSTENINKLYQMTGKYGMSLEQVTNTVGAWDKELRKGLITIEDLANIQISGRNMTVSSSAGLAQTLINSGQELPKELMESAGDPIKASYILRKLLSEGNPQVIKAIQANALEKAGGDKYKAAMMMENSEAFGSGLFSKEMIFQTIFGDKKLAASTSEYNYKGALSTTIDASEEYKKLAGSYEQIVNDTNVYFGALNTTIQKQIEIQEKGSDTLKNFYKNTVGMSDGMANFASHVDDIIPGMTMLENILGRINIQSDSTTTSN